MLRLRPQLQFPIVVQEWTVGRLGNHSYSFILKWHHGQSKVCDTWASGSTRSLTGAPSWARHQRQMKRSISKQISAALLMYFFLADISNTHKLNCSKFFDKLIIFRSYVISERINEHNERGHHKKAEEAQPIQLTASTSRGEVVYSQRPPA